MQLYFCIPVPIHTHSLSLSLNFQDYGELSAFVKKQFEMDLEEIELSVKGWNWGTAKFKG